LSNETTGGVRCRGQSSRRAHISVTSDHSGTFSIPRKVIRGPGRKTIDVTVVHTESRGNKNSIVDFQVGSAEPARMRDIFRKHILASALDLSRNG
jgi:hypothetical protein